MLRCSDVVSRIYALEAYGSIGRRWFTKDVMSQAEQGQAAGHALCYGVVVSQMSPLLRRLCSSNSSCLVLLAPGVEAGDDLQILAQ